MLSVFKTGIDGEIAKIENLRQAHRYLPDNIYSALDLFRDSEWISKLLGADVKERYAELKQNSADRCPRLLGTAGKDLPKFSSTTRFTTSTCGTSSRFLLQT